jgi:hypothetical protein
VGGGGEGGGGEGRDEGREGKGREGKGREGKGREGKGREGKGRGEILQNSTTRHSGNGIGKGTGNIVVANLQIL